MVDAILGDMLKLDYVVDSAVQGRLTLRTGSAVSRDALLTALETALATVAVAIVPEGSVLRVMPMELAPQRARGAHRYDPTAAAVPGYAIEIISLRFVAPTEMQRVLDASVPKGTVLQADDDHGQRGSDGCDHPVHGRQRLRRVAEQDGALLVAQVVRRRHERRQIVRRRGGR